MKKIYITLFLLFAMTAQTAFAQGAPGLLGNRFSVFYNMDFFYNVGQYTYNEANKEMPDQPDGMIAATVSMFTNPGVNITRQHNIQLDYSITRFKSIGIGLSYFRNGYGTIQTGQRVDVASKNLTSISGSIFYKTFLRSSGGFAPLGNYYQYGLHANQVQESTRENSMLFDEPRNYIGRQYIIPSFTFTFGRQFIAYKSLLMNVGAEIGTVYPFRGFSLDSLENSMERLALFYTFRFKVGVGLAPF